MLNNETTPHPFTLSTKIEHQHVYIYQDGICTINGQTFQVKKGDTIQINYQSEEN